jgi:hypothetical protein
MASEALPRRSQGFRRGLIAGRTEGQAEEGNSGRSTSYIDAVQALTQSLGQCVSALHEQ